MVIDKPITNRIVIILLLFLVAAAVGFGVPASLGVSWAAAIAFALVLGDGHER